MFNQNSYIIHIKMEDTEQALNLSLPRILDLSAKNVSNSFITVIV
jgi:hypothetical protein